MACGFVVVLGGCCAAVVVARDAHAASAMRSQVATSRLDLEAVPLSGKRRKLLRRAIWLLWSFSLALLLSPVAFLSKAFREDIYFGFLFRAIVYSRSAALIKWSQWASVRMDLLPVTLCLLLSRLQSQAPVHSLEQTIAEVEAAGICIGHRSEEHIAGTASEHLGRLTDLAEAPLASGAIAQVHLACWGSEQVVVKVRHPNVYEELLLDIELIRHAATALDTFVPSLRGFNAPGTVAQFESSMSGQCDLAQEARHLDSFRLNFARKASWMVFPRVFFASSGVLVESFEPGDLGTTIVRRGTTGDRAEAHFLIARGEDVYLQMLLVDNFMHADLHPGNMLYRRDGATGTPQLVLLDAGMACFLTDEERRNYIGLVQSIGNGDGKAMAKNVLRFSRKGNAANAEAFTADIEAMCAEKCRGYFTGLDIGEVVREMMQAMYRHCVPIDGNYATLIANMLCLEGMARAIEPRFSVIDVAYPLLRAHELLGDHWFQQIFFVVNRVLPLFLFESLHKAAIYGALNGPLLKAQFDGLLYGTKVV